MINNVVPTLKYPKPVTLRAMVVVFFIYLLCGWLGIKYGTMEGASLSMLWLPSGVGLVACVLYGWAVLPVIWLASFVTNTPFLLDQAAQFPYIKALLFGSLAATIDTGTQAWLSYVLFRKTIGDGDIHSARNILNYLIKVTLLPSMVSMLLLTLLYASGGYIQYTTPARLLSVWLAGTMADYHGFFVAGLFGLAWLARMGTALQRPRFNYWMFLIFSAFIGLVLASIFWDSAVVYLLTMLGVLVAMYWGLRAATTFVLCISLALTVATVNQFGPFVTGDNFSSLATLLVFVFSLGVPIYLLAANRYELMRSRLDLEDKVVERTRELHAANKRLEALSNSDGLTGLANRRYFDQRLADEWRRVARDGEPLAVAMIDVDWFKKYNDCYGHLAGDQCLQLVAKSLAEHVCRAGDLVARYGGEEFIFLLPGASTDNAVAIAQRVCDAVRQQQIPHKASPLGWVTISVGVAAMLPDITQHPEVLIKMADDALYRSKAQGRNSVQAA